MKPRLKFQVIYKNRKEYPVTAMCHFFEVSRSGYYEYIKRMDQPDRDESLAKLITQRRSQRYGRSLGCRRMQKWLEKFKGVHYNYKTVWRVMRKYGLFSEIRRKRFYRSSEILHVYPNWLDREFHSNTPNTKWVTDVSYLQTAQGTVYLSVIQDLFDRKVVAYKMSTRNDAKLVSDTIKAAMKMQTVTVERQLHSDQGSGYTSNEYYALTQEYGITPSMSRRGNPYDNAVVESFFSALKAECIYMVKPSKLSQVKRLVHDYIEFYNNERMALN